MLGPNGPSIRALSLAEAREAAFGRLDHYPSLAYWNGRNLKFVLRRAKTEDRVIELHKCKRCDRAVFGVWLQQRYANGDRVAVLRCLLCGDQIWSSRLGRLGRFEFPMWSDDINHAPCERCGSRGGTEEHHWAPRHLFGDDADNWPTSRLCRKCHAYWHRKVTPTMSQLGKIA